MLTYHAKERAAERELNGAVNRCVKSYGNGKLSPGTAVWYRSDARPKHGASCVVIFSDITLVLGERMQPVITVHTNRTSLQDWRRNVGDAERRKAAKGAISCVK